MGYNEAYLNLLSQQAARRAQNLRDVANIGAQAQMASAEAWGRVPGTLAAIGTRFAGDIMDYKSQQDKLKIEREKANVAEMKPIIDASNKRQVAEAYRIYGEEDPNQFRAQANMVDPAFASTIEKDAAATRKDDFQTTIARINALPNVLKSAEWALGRIPTNQQENDHLREVLTAHATLAGNPSLVDAVPAVFDPVKTPQAVAAARQWVDQQKEPVNAFQVAMQAFQTRNGRPPRTDEELQQVLKASTLPAAPKTDMTPQPMIGEDGKRAFGVYDPAANKLVPVAGGSPIPPQPSAATIALNMPTPAAIPVTAIRPSPEEGNQPVPGTFYTKNTLYEAGKKLALLNQKPTLQRQTGPMANQSLSAVENTANALAASVGMSIPELQAEYAAERATLRKRAGDLAANESYALSMRTGLDQALKLSRKVTSFDSPTANKVENFFKRTLTGDPSLSAYEMWVAGVTRDYARITVGGADSVAQLYQGAADKADQLLNPAMNDKQIKAVLDSMVQDVNVILRSKRETVEATKQRIANFLNDEPTDVVPPMVDLSGGQSPAPALTPVGALGLKTSDGRVLTFKTQAERNKAMREGNQMAPAPKKVDWIWDPATQSFKKG